MSQPVNVYVPCDVLAVKVRVGPQESLSVLEELFLRAVYAGVSSFQELADLFGIGHRPTLDLVFDLWHRGHLVVDHTHGAVHLSANVAQKTAQDQLADLGTAEVKEETWEVMLDRLTGHVLPVLRGEGPSTGEGRAVVPVEYFDVGPQDVTTAGLLAALRRISESDEEPGQRPKRVLGAHLSIPELAPAAKQGWLRLEVRCSADAESDRLKVRLADSPGLPAAARTRAAERLTRLIEDQPASPFVQYLRNSASPEVVAASDAGEMLRELEEDIAALATLNPAQWYERQRRLDVMADRLEEECLRREGASVRVEVIAGHEAHARAAVELISEATRQVVIACPFVGYSGLQPLLRPLEDALKRGVQVFLLWGIGADEELKSSSVRNALTQLHESFRHLFFVSQRSSRTHAKLVVRDNRRALVTSLNLLRPSGPETLEVGVILTAKDDGPCPPVEGLLEWARGAYPEYLIGQSLYVDHEEFRLGSTQTSADLGLQRPVAPSAALDAELTQVAGRLWHLSWVDYCRAVRERLGAVPEGARVLRNGQHRDALWLGLRAAQQRLVITSDQLGPEVLDAQFFHRVEERLQAGVSVAIVYRRLTEAAVQAGSTVEEQLKALAARYPDRLQLASGVPTHAKILVYDDVAIVSSFNFLSFDGYYETRQTGSWRRQRSEIGVQFTGGAVELVIGVLRDAFSSIFNSWPAGMPPVAAGAAPVPLLPVTPEEQQRLLSGLRERPDEATRAAVLRVGLAAVREPWWLLRRLEEAGLARWLLRVGAATLVAATPGEAASSERRRWLQWLAEDAWDRGRFVEAAVFLHTHSDLVSPRMPRPSLALLAAAWVAGQTPRALVEAYLTDDLSQAERATIATISAVELLLRGTREAEEIMESLEESVRPPLRRLLDQVLTYWRQTYQPLPLAHIRVDVASAEHRHALAQAWEELDTALQKLQGTNFRFDSGTKTQAHLYHENGALGQLLRRAAARDGGGIQAWLREEAIDDLGDFLDNATRAANPDLALIERAARQAVLAKLRAIVGAARKVAGLVPLAVSGESSTLLAAAKGLARGVREGWQALQEEVATPGAPEGILGQVVLNSLRELADWGAD